MRPPEFIARTLNSICPGPSPTNGAYCVAFRFLAKNLVTLPFVTQPRNRILITRLVVVVAKR